MDHITGQVYRPPEEHSSILIEVTKGCSHNSCVFCSLYNQAPFRMIDLESIQAEVQEWAEALDGRPSPRVYLTGGDPLILPTERLLDIANMLHSQLQGVESIGCYASFKNFKHKDVQDLKKLKEAGYDGLYIGAESGHKDMLEKLNMGVDLKEAREALSKLKEVHISYHAFIMLGIAGRGKGIENAQATAELLNFYPPLSLSFATTTVGPHTELEKMRQRGDFIEATEREKLQEQIQLIESLEAPGSTYLYAAHPINLARIKGPLAERKRLVREIQDTIEKTPAAELDQVLARPEVQG